jgi:ankyrin repeat protein
MKTFVNALALFLTLAPGTVSAAQANLNQSLATASWEGDIERIRMLVKNGADVNVRLSQCDVCPGRTGTHGGDMPLVLAAQNGKTEAVKLLLKLGANIESADDARMTPLMAAAAAGQTETVRLLIGKGAKVDAGGMMGRTALMWAALNDHTDTARALLDGGADVNSIPSPGQDTALVGAAYRGNLQLVRLLLDRGGKLDPGPGRMTALGASAWGNNPAMLELILEHGAPLETHGQGGRTALEFAAIDDAPVALRLLLAKGADPEARSDDGETALLVAAALGSTEGTRLLLEHGANVEARMNDGRSALWLAALNHRSGKVRLLLDAGADASAKSNDGRTPLIAAACSAAQSDEAMAAKQLIVRWLIARGADAAATDNKGDSALTCKYHLNPATLPAAIAQAVDLRAQIVAMEAKPAAERFDGLRSLAAQYSDEPYLRDLLLKAALELPQLPPIPEEARALMHTANEQIRQAASPSALDAPIASLFTALKIAPWWGNAYFNLARAQEMQGKYEAAILSLNRYLSLKPNDASEVRALLAKIDREEAAADQQ